MNKFLSKLNFKQCLKASYLVTLIAIIDTFIVYLLSSYFGLHDLIYTLPTWTQYLIILPVIYIIVFLRKNFKQRVIALSLFTILFGISISNVPIVILLKALALSVLLYSTIQYIGLSIKKDISKFIIWTIYSAIALILLLILVHFFIPSLFTYLVYPLFGIFLILITTEVYKNKKKYNEISTEKTVMFIVDNSFLFYMSLVIIWFTFCGMLS
jgi:hypothetical protein